MADEPKRETVSLRLAIIVGTTIAAAFTLTQLVVNTVSKSGDRSSEHAHELAMVIVEQMKVQHQDNLNVQEQHRQAIDRIAENIEQFAEEQRVLSETLRSAYRLPPRSRKTP